ncbi:hypothetical protein A2630_00460 [Candidatus Woesebacteria bacterium RIFCSPHIGHO2_01_FULL_44_10]|uniref:peptidylprolyl isomerase n=1 Tax=Candidatus Woesebacteria bacterium RIFCSPLOWO2_01_FULL_44_14 TaxID=1802525 RepID=A0A1F8C1R4_9BACT|nr:MAG: hypothetical protein A2630_00460 [Candidatus Woesebacteria bacterium RIFCSPHIGHO2_01_FULL_44_10]OGM54401.1 MAG: hypothetical protein A3F62_01465 [Candidatus Woesebacteria bacterium RIFCSPHIGHO2_12_FULL_44_11]OGM70304.1 MAG: hypothetical protein A2975_04515 [Candidatus Woesebacteria bacterium RIFCSPLOWO2_01_FULL_44_14]
MKFADLVGWVVRVAAAVALFFLLRNLFSAAIINGESVSRVAVIRQLERVYGAEVLDNMVTDVLIMQEAKERGIKVTKEEINQKIDELRAQFSSQDRDFDQILAEQKIDQAELARQMELRIIVEKLVGDAGAVTEEEITAAIEQNRAFFPEGTSDEELRASAESQVKNQKISTQINTLIEELRQKANIQTLATY